MENTAYHLPNQSVMHQIVDQVPLKANEELGLIAIQIGYRDLPICCDLNKWLPVFQEKKQQCKIQTLVKRLSNLHKEWNAWV